MRAAFFAQAQDHWLDELISRIAHQAPPGTFLSEPWNLHALLAFILVSLSCGAVGSLVVGGRLAFFSDALAHCAFAGVSIGFVLFALFSPSTSREDFWALVTVVMLAFGGLIGFSIAAVRDRTGLASDTVIGVFFAGCLGLAAMLRNLMQSRELFNLDDFLFGDPLRVRGPEEVHLALLALLVAGVLLVIYNPLLLGGFSNSLALARNIPARVANYVFIILLAFVVNLCVRTVGVLLINALLIVPAATAANVSRNLRQLFWLTIALCLGSSLLGLLLSWEVETRTGARLGESGAIVLISVALFGLSMVLGPRWRERPARQPPTPTV
jgi:zinc transport system permease protein